MRDTDGDLRSDRKELAAAGVPESLRARARHVVTENARVLEAVGLLRSGELDRLGPLLAASHASLRDDYEVSSPELDTAVEAAVDAGAVGARMTGAGFGGSAIAYNLRRGLTLLGAEIFDGFVIEQRVDGLQHLRRWRGPQL